MGEDINQGGADADNYIFHRFSIFLSYHTVDS